MKYDEKYYPIRKKTCRGQLGKTSGLVGAFGFGPGDPDSASQLCIALSFLPHWIWMTVLKCIRDCVGFTLDSR